MSKKDNIASFGVDLDYNTWLNAGSSFSYDKEIVLEVVDVLAPDNTSYIRSLQYLFDQIEDQGDKDQFIKDNLNGK